MKKEIVLRKRSSKMHMGERRVTVTTNQRIIEIAFHIDYHTHKEFMSYMRNRVIFPSFFFVAYSVVVIGKGV